MLKKLFCVCTILAGVLFSSVGFAEDSTSGLEQKFQGFNLQGYDDKGEKAWDVNGDTADLEGTQVKIKNVNANSYGANSMNVTAESGMIDQLSGEMQLRKDVIITNEDGSQLLTDSLDWSREKDVVSTKDEVLITDKKYTITGKGMEAKPGLKEGKIEEDVTVRVNTNSKSDDPADGEFVTITSDGPMTLDQTNLVAVFEKNVIAVQLDRTLKADRIELYIDADNQIKEMVCIGNVEIIQGENKSFAERASYNATKKTLTLMGRPKLIMQTKGDNAFTTSRN